MIAPILLALALSTGIDDAPLPKPARWSAVAGQSFCGLEPRLDARSGRSFSLETVPGTSNILLSISSSEGESVTGKEPVTVTLSDGQPLSASVQRGIRAPGAEVAFFVADLPQDFADRFSRTILVRVVRGTQILLDASVRDAGEAVALLRSCDRELLRKWGVDPMARAALRRVPEPIGGVASWISADDYPSDALRNEFTGRVVARLDVDAAGAITGCEVVVGSGHASLDAQTCLLATARGRFQPALSRDGAPVSSNHIFSVFWSLPE